MVWTGTDQFTDGPILPCLLGQTPGASGASQGWALTAHRAQGASLETGAVAMLRGLFSPGQVTRRRGAAAGSGAQIRAAKCGESCRTEVAVDRGSRF